MLTHPQFLFNKIVSLTDSNDERESMWIAGPSPTARTDLRRGEKLIQ